ncbi:hypothetical protein LCGC14_0449930 [marine sediment metagenome]|uniref:DDH domain-containing protein n=1 Tax=marine sediment metagenome TaxID=412755 RepID=A0A0F9VS20_9ZZZZ|nr:bifunctional oligoribonuclease/PAP phosphatase NrnA [Phycisphaerae bacterium]HDZ43337.1 bifunctional oligoribonuclease/PAP phosphatase NrnA [Phycisphaerae bacterium]
MFSVSESSAQKTFDEVCQRIESAASLLVISHARPDGDTLGAMAGLRRAARSAGKTVAMVLPDRLPVRYEFLFPDERPASVSRFEALAGEADVIVVLDTCAANQLGGLPDKLAAIKAKVVVIDHHATPGQIGDLQWIDTSSAATGILVGDILAELGWSVDRQTAEALLTAILTDTGWLRFANTDSRCLRMVADLLDRGVRLDVLYRRIYQNDRLERIKLMARVLDGLELHGDGRIAVATICREDFAATGARPDETENLVNEALRMGSVEVSLMLIENADGVRVSLRSREIVDVAAIAERLGGGGHTRAAGVQLSDSLEVVKDRLLHACQQLLAEASGRSAGGGGRKRGG